MCEAIEKKHNDGDCINRRLEVDVQEVRQMRVNAIVKTSCSMAEAQQ